MFLRIFKYSFINLLKTRSIWVFFAVNVAISVLCALILPIFVVPMREYFGFTVVSTTIFSILSLHSSMISESNSNPAERVFILARPVKRSTYLWSKICSSLCVTISLSLTIIAIWYSSTFFFLPNVFKIYSYNTPSANYGAFVFLDIFSIVFLSTIFGSIFRNFLKNKVASILIMIFILTIYMVTDILYGTNWKNWLQINDYLRLIFLWFPLFLFLPLAAIFTIIGFKLNNKEDIRI